MVSVVDSFNTALLKELSANGEADPRALERASAAADREKSRLDRILLRLGLIEEAALMPALCRVLDIAEAGLIQPLNLDRAAALLLTTPYMSSQVIAPIETDHGDLRIAMADPANLELRQELAFHLGHPVVAIGSPTATIRKILAAADAPLEHETSVRDAQLTRDQLALRKGDIDGPVIKFVQEKLTDAVMQGASDIHFESVEDGISVRYRINGILVPQRVEMGLNPAGVLARLKVMAEANVAERRLPQDGRLGATIAGRHIDFRFSSLPTQLGESIVCRVLDPKALRLGWDKLGFDPTIVAAVRRIIERPSGLFLVTGPTGSGKTTTLYTAIAHLNTQARKIVTVEDPVEYNLPGIQQVQVHEEIGLTFARVLRSILRHDPNVILIGEIRDQETAEIACRAAQVGRMVLSTLHTNSAAGAFTRLVDLGVPEFVVRDVLRGVLGQDLQITGCADCGGAGCSGCGGSGVVGRRLLAELWEV